MAVSSSGVSGLFWTVPVTPGNIAIWLEPGVLADGGAPSTGSVTSVGLALPVSVFNVTGSPVTGAGTLTGAFATQTANTVFVGPTTGAAAVPAFRALVNADLPDAIVAGGPSGSSTVAPVITYNSKGVLTAVTTATITPAVGSITGLGAGVGAALVNTAGGAGGFALVGTTPPTGSAGGDLAGTYPSPTLNTAISTAVAFSALGKTVVSVAGAAGAPAFSLSGAWLTTTASAVPQVLIQASGASAFSGNASGTGLGINAASGFAGRLADFQTNGGSVFSVTAAGSVIFGGSSVANVIGSAGSALYGTVSVGTSNNAIVLYNNGSISFSSSSSVSANQAIGDTIIGRGGAAATLRHGAADADTNAAVVAQFVRAQGLAAGGTSNQAGKDFTIQGSPGKGTGAGGALALQTTPAGTTGTSVNAFATGLTVTAPAVSQQPSVVVGNQALATNATDGFLYIPSGAGPPTGTPTAFTGRVALYYDSTNDQLYVYQTAWKQPKTPAGAAIVNWQ